MFSRFIGCRKITFVSMFSLGLAIACAGSEGSLNSGDTGRGGAGYAGSYESNNAFAGGTGGTGTTGGGAAGVGPVFTNGCASAGQFAPDTTEAFDACEGEPFGTWRLTSVDALYPLQVYRSDLDGLAGECPVEVGDIDIDFQMAVSLLDGGDAVVVTDMPLATSIPFRFLEDCFKREADSLFDCESVDWADYINCSYECGACNCEYTILQRLYGNWDGRWSRSDGKLHIEHRDGDYHHYEYCVIDDVMRLKYVPGLVWVDTIIPDDVAFFYQIEVAFTMERVLYGGMPLECSQRSLDNCETSGNSSDTCRLVGTCTGGSQCVGDSEASCTNHQGCSWSDEERCVGSVPDGCTLSDADVIPGCRFYDTSARCVGTPGPCTELETGECETVSGCELGQGCIGTPIIDCSYWNGDCLRCNGIPECSCADDGTCGGTPVCEAQTIFETCHWTTGCEWVESTCQGTPEPCDQFSVQECASFEGCRVE